MEERSGHENVPGKRKGHGMRVKGIVITGLVCLLAGGFVGGWLLGGFGGGRLVDSQTETSDSRILQSVTRTEKVALLSLRVQGIAKKTSETTIFGMEVPGSDRALFLQYNFTASLGVDGKDVVVERTGDKEITVTVPRFIFIGYDDVSFELAAEDNGILSWTNPEIDTAEMIDNILSEDAMQDYISANQETLKEQAKAYYSGIATCIDSTVTVKLSFSSPS